MLYAEGSKPDPTPLEIHKDFYYGFHPALNRIQNTVQMKYLTSIATVAKPDQLCALRMKE